MAKNQRTDAKNPSTPSNKAPVDNKVNKNIKATKSGKK